eukprot:COSAG06_NODE_4410_length_4290_cov_1.978764_3_plen_216_part_00
MSSFLSIKNDGALLFEPCLVLCYLALSCLVLQDECITMRAVPPFYKLALVSETGAPVYRRATAPSHTLVSHTCLTLVSEITIRIAHLSKNDDEMSCQDKTRQFRTNFRTATLTQTIPLAFSPLCSSPSVCSLAWLALSLFVLCLNSEFCEPVNFAFSMNEARLTFEQQVKKTHISFAMPLYTTIVPRRQARDKHRKSTLKPEAAFFLTGRPHAAQ